MKLKTVITIYEGNQTYGKRNYNDNITYIFLIYQKNENYY